MAQTSSIYALLQSRQEESLNDESDHVVDDEQPETAVEQTSQQRSRYTWNLIQTFEEEEVCANFIQSEECWTKVRPVLTTNGIKTLYRCRFPRTRGQQCSAGIYTIHSMRPGDDTHYLYRKDAEHDHEVINNVPKRLSDEIKKLIEGYVEDGLTLSKILHKLRHTHNLHDPEKNQVKNYIKTYRKRRFGDSKVTIQDIIDFCELHKTIPEGVDTAFVLDYHHSPIEEPVDESGDVESDDECAEPWIGFIVTTKRLLRNAANSNIVCADATHKLVIERYPVLVFGVTDLDSTQHFHLLGIMVSKFERTEDFQFGFQAIKEGIQKIANIEFAPKYLMSDAAGAIHAAAKNVYGDITILMCYAHVKESVNKQTFANAKANKDRFKADLTLLSSAYSRDVFLHGWEKFSEKWTPLEPAVIDRLHKSWIRRNENWFSGAAFRTPNTNNALESYNRNLKVHQTYYQRKGLAEFKVRLLEIVRNRSGEYEKDRDPFKYEIAISNRMQKDGLRYSKIKKTVFQRMSDERTVIYMSRGENPAQFEQEDVDAFLNANYNSFDDMANHMFDYYIITFDNDPEKWRLSTCTCPTFARNFMCKHILCIAYQLKIISAKAHEPLTANTKRGRPAKATGALTKE